MEKLKSIDIKGKEYVLINERVRYFKENYENGKIITELLSDHDGVCTFKASIIINGEVVSTGHSQEKEGSTFINKTSYLENCETSAVGRALGFAGIGIDTSIASFEEVQNAILNQENRNISDKERIEMSPINEGQKQFVKEQDENKIKEYLKKVRKSKISELTFKEADDFLKLQRLESREVF